MSNERHEDFHGLVVLCTERLAASKRFMAQIEQLDAGGQRDHALDLLAEWRAQHAADMALMQAARQAKGGTGDRPAR